MTDLIISQNLSDSQPDFIYGNDGHAGLSQTKTGELLKANQSSVSRALKRNALFSPEETESIKQQGFRGYALVKLARHFAKSKQTPTETKDHCIEFLEKSAIIGVQTFIDRLAGIPDQLSVQPNPEPQQSALFGTIDKAIDCVTQALIQAGISESLAMSFKLTQYAKRDTGNVALYEEAKRLLNSQSDIPDPLYSPTEIGKKLADTLGVEKAFSAQKVNQALIEAGLQLAKIEEKKKDGRLIAKTVYHLTERGREFGQMITDTARGHGKTVFSIRWLESVVDELVYHIGS